MDTSDGRAARTYILVGSIYGVELMKITLNLAGQPPATALLLSWNKTSTSLALLYHRHEYLHPSIDVSSRDPSYLPYLHYPSHPISLLIRTRSNPVPHPPPHTPFLLRTPPYPAQHNTTASCLSCNQSLFHFHFHFH